MKFKFNDGGRKAAGFKGDAVGDCGTRALAIAAQRDYAEAHKVVCDSNGFDEAEDNAFIRKYRNADTSRP